VLTVDESFPVTGYTAYEETDSEQRAAFEDAMEREDIYQQEWGS